MKSSPRVTLVIPVHNAEERLQDTLQSVLDQSLSRREIEVIAVDDASTDRSVEILRDFAATYGNARVIECPSCSGAAGAPRNLGISLAEGDYLQFLDDDDLLVPEACETLVRAIEQLHSDTVSARFEMVDPSGSCIPEIFDVVLPEPLQNVTAEDHPELFAPPPAVWSRIFRRSFVVSRAIRFPEGPVGQDGVFVVETLLRAARNSTINDTVCRYRVRVSDQPPSASCRLDLQFFEDVVRTRILIMQSFRKHSCLDYYDVLYYKHVRYLLDRVIAAFVYNRRAIPDVLATVSPFFKEFDRLNLKFEEPILRILIELIGCQMHDAFVEIIELLQLSGLLTVKAEP